MKLSIVIDKLLRLEEEHGNIEFQLLDNEFGHLFDEPVIQYQPTHNVVSVSLYADEDIAN